MITTGDVGYVMLNNILPQTVLTKYLRTIALPKLVTQIINLTKTILTNHVSLAKKQVTQLKIVTD